MDTLSKRDALMHLFDSGRVNGVAYLFALIALGRASAPELSELCGDERHTVGRYLQRLESRGFAQRVQSGNGELWFPTPKALEMFGVKLSGDSRPQEILPKTQVENLPKFPSSSSSDQIDQSIKSDLIRSDLEEEETRQKNYLNEKYGLTGDKASAISADPWVTPLRMVAWMSQVKGMKRDGFKFTKSPEAYAIRCLLRHDEPNRDAYHLAPGTLAEYLRWMPCDDDVEDIAAENSEETDA